jgi:phage/plasmid-like protein (TIGR03299 family)
MTAAVEVSGWKAAFASRKDPAWHLLGTVFAEDEDVNTEGMLSLSHLNGWDVHLVPVKVPGVSNDRHVREEFAVVRTNPFDGEKDVLGFVGGRYTVFQNEEVMTFAQDVIGSLGRWETMGSINGGTQVFGSLIVPQEVVLDPKGRGDVVRQYLLAAASHDGSMALTVMNTPVRVVCQNTLNVALSGARQAFKIKHTTSMSGKVQTAREVTLRQQGYMDAFSKEASAMIERELVGNEFDQIVAAAFPAPDKDASKAAQTRYANRLDLIQSIYTGAADGPNTTDNITGTAWGALNTLTEAVDWYRKPRKGDAESVATAASGFDPVINTEKNRLFKIVKEFVTA